MTAARVHTVALVGHGGTGKTTLAEALLHQAGVIARPGRVEDGTTVFDFEPEELRRHLSVALAVAPFDHGEHKVNVVDTPGFADFIVEVQLALDAADLAVFVVSATDGVQVQTEVIWRLASAASIPRLFFVNKLDHERADYERTLGQLRDTFGSGIAPLEIPIVEGGRFVGVADLLADEAITYTKSGEAPPVGTSGPIPEHMAELEHRLRDSLVEGIVVADDAQMERYLEGDIPSPAELEETLATGIETGTVFPVLCGSALTGVAVGRLASFICEIGHDRAVHARAGDQEVSIARDPAGQPLARVVKTTTDPFIGRVSLLEVVSGTLRPDIVLLNTRTKSEERLHVLQTLVGKNATPVSEARAGDLVAVPKLDDVRVGDTLAPKGTPVEVPLPPLARPSLSVAVRPKSRGDEDRLMTGLHRLEEEDPGLSVHRNDETHQTVVTGIGETHLAVTEERLARKFHVEVEHDELLIPYRETITKPSAAEGRHKKQTGGHGQFGVCHLRLEPLGRGEGFLYVDEVVGGAIPRQFIPAVEKGVMRAMRQGGAFGFPVVDVKVTVDDGKFHPVDSSEASFEMAGALGFGEALRNAAPVPLEPVSRLEVRVPVRFQGEVLGDINTRRARVLSSEPDTDGDQVIVALVPTAELRRYAIELRALSGGYGRFSATHDRYEPLPAHLVDKLAKVSAEAS
ncbi:MAG TPA: elongation factor G [Acidimicrobiales bacterium]|nr:elongation factor G [Acidimicrobiales bacterium]